MTHNVPNTDREMQSTESPAQEPRLITAVMHECIDKKIFGYKNYVLIMLPIVLSSVYNGQYVFNAGKPGYRCEVPECEKPPLDFKPGLWAAFALPSEDKSSCYRYEPTGSTCTNASFTHTLQRCYSWVYEDDYTIVSEFGLACEEWKRTMVGSTHSFGLFAGLFFIGYISDRIGRKRTFIITATSPALFGFIRAFSVNFTMYVVFEFLEAFFTSGAYTTGYVLALEMVSKKKRVLAGGGLAMGFAFGQVLLAFLAALIPQWRILTLVIYIPSIFFAFYYFCLTESVRWLLTNGKKKEAYDIIMEAAHVNRVFLDERVIQRLVSDEPAVPSKTDLQSNTRSPWSEALHSRIILLRLFICSFGFVAVTFIYYGLSINSVSLDGNKYLNYGLTALMEFPGYTISMFTMDRFGRKKTIIIAFLVCGTALVAMPFFPVASRWGELSLSLVGKGAASTAITGAYVFALELFPTCLRHRLLSVCCIAGRIGLLLAPYSPLLMDIHRSLPYLVFGVTAFGAGILMMSIPETLHKSLPDTVEQAEHLGRPLAPVEMHPRSSLANVTSAHNVASFITQAQKQP